MAGRERTVYFLEPFFRDSNNEAHDAPQGFWVSLMDHVQTLSAADRLKRISSVRYRGNARSVGSPEVRFLYIGKRRNRQDWPDTSVGGADEEPLEVDGELVEPMYLLPVPDTNYVGVLRTSGGPTFAAATEWIGQVLQSQGDEMDFFLRSVVRHDALDRLHGSAGVSMLDIKLAAGAFVPEDAGRISSVVDTLRAQGGADLSIGIRLSFGNAAPDTGTARELARDVERVLRGGNGLKNVVAKLIENKNDGSISKEELHFLNDRITHKVMVGQSEAELPTAEVVINAMSQAVTTFKAQLGNIFGTADEEEEDGNEDGDEEE
ncbi:hypothetical protein MMAN_26000 [Mycobacterium mantenii]|uniref:EF-hand domain-containing protein n=1 Tax=Mycobacterium mantenii TaxID=560555 RepID=A0ABM7JSD9_MYCNT|nr:hypothetical protein [Mycobacterium mantenii]MCV7243217.1 hypothetical protein [Mycobacterium mantenii]BBY38466.1 hypothetical protein MMAN_26000 [Mycobacterium mantenii]